VSISDEPMLQLPKMMFEENVWRTNSGDVLMMCVACEFDDARNPRPSCNIFEGYSLCLEHLHIVKDALRINHHLNIRNIFI